MNENDQTNPPLPPPIPNIVSYAEPLATPPKPLSWWLRKFFACNPFYLLSAALLLYGCYRVSLDTPFFDREVARLEFNFTSVQIYEVLLVVVAIFLAGRSLWYDSTLLVGLEVMLLFVPFILISQAALTDSSMTFVMCATGVGAAILRFASLRKYFRQLNLPDRLLSAGFILLVFNVALPLMYRHFQEIKYGTYLEYGPAYDMNKQVWLLMLPIVLALANFVPASVPAGQTLPQQRWLPLGMFSVWMIVTGLHLYCLDYIFEFYLRPEFFAPAALVLAWTVFLRCPRSYPRWRYAAMFPALAVPFLACSPGNSEIFVVLAGLNIAGYVMVIALEHENRLAPHLAYAAATLLLAGLPADWLRAIAPHFANIPWLRAGLAAYVIFWTVWSRNPIPAIFGSIILWFGVFTLLGEHAPAAHLALQGALVFLILHSLRWNEEEHPQVKVARVLIAAAWGFFSFVWVNSDSGRLWLPFIPAAVVLVVYCICYPLRGIWRIAVVPIAALVVAASGPISALVKGVSSLPVGFLAMGGSFVLLALGTIAALTRHLWHKHEAESAAPSPQLNQPGQ